MEEETPPKEMNKEIFDIEEVTARTKDIKQNILKIEIANGYGTGFLCKIYVNDKPIPVLITCYHVINQEYIKDKDFLFFSFPNNNELIEKTLNLNIKRIIYQNEVLDVTFIEIKEEDGLDIYSFLEMDNSISSNNPNMLHEYCYLLHYPDGAESIKLTQGEIEQLIENYNLLTNSWTKLGSSGAPIINYKNNYVLGVHRSSYKVGKEITGKGTILNYAAKKFSEEKSEEILMLYKNLYCTSNTMDMIYIIPKNENNIKLFSNKFFDMYAIISDLIILKYNGHDYSFKQYFNVNEFENSDIIKGEARITLKGVEYINNMDYMFSGCNELKKVIAKETDFSNVISMIATFEKCNNLEEIANTSNWNLENVISLKGLFYMCPKLKDVPGIENWNPIKVRNCEEMFFSCKSIDPSVIAKVENWKNVKKDVKDLCKKGYTSNNLFAYIAFDNFQGTVNYISNKFNFFKKK